MLKIEGNKTDHCATENDDSENQDDEAFNNETETSSFLPHNANAQLESDAIQNEIRVKKLRWPTVIDDPFNEYNTPFLATLAFPTLFPDGSGDPLNPALHSLIEIFHLLTEHYPNQKKYPVIYIKKIVHLTSLYIR